ncbi:MAG TPA: hypothetical protein VK461_00385 [Acidimicrobiales bacterium]|nr:hypothetical protein [Acidimicrobiales bacterium]
MAPQVYELSFRGAASDTLAAGFEGCEVMTSDDVTTVRALVPDQAALQGMISQVHGFGLELLEVRIVASR